MTIQLTWASTSNPYQGGTIDVTKSGWVTMNAGYTFNGSGATNIVAYRFFLEGGNTISYGFRMVGHTPSSTTANSVNFAINYFKYNI